MKFEKPVKEKKDRKSSFDEGSKASSVQPVVEIPTGGNDNSYLHDTSAYTSNNGRTKSNIQPNAAKYLHKLLSHKIHKGSLFVP